MVGDGSAPTNVVLASPGCLWMRDAPRAGGNPPKKAEAALFF